MFSNQVGVQQRHLTALVKQINQQNVGNGRLWRIRADEKGWGKGTAFVMDLPTGIGIPK